MKKLKILLLLFFHVGCTSKTDNTDCMDCGGGLLDGYLYKEVTIEDIADLAEIDVSVEAGKCIRFKMEENQFSDAKIVEDCCCIQFN